MNSNEAGPQRRTKRRRVTRVVGLTKIMQELSDIQNITSKLKRNQYRLIAIDGVDGSGKSTLSRKLADELGYEHINLDDFVVENCGQFVQNIKYDELVTKLDNAAVPFIIDGVCVLAILERLHKKPDMHILLACPFHFCLLPITTGPYYCNHPKLSHMLVAAMLIKAWLITIMHLKISIRQFQWTPNYHFYI